MQRNSRLTLTAYLVLGTLTLGIAMLCICLGSVNVPAGETLRIIMDHLGLGGQKTAYPAWDSIIWTVRFPRVICVALSGAALSVGGASMQGLLKNPLADGSTLGVASGASLGAALSIALGIRLPGIPAGGTVSMSILFAFGSLLLILMLAYRLDHSLSTNTIILIGMIFSMFINSILSLLIAFAPDRVKNITFWTMGSLAGSSLRTAALLFFALLLCGGILLGVSGELNAFAIGEENAAGIGVDVRKIRLIVLITVSVLIGVCVSVGGSIGFVGLVTPHMVRRLVGPNHHELLPACLLLGADFLMLSDLIARVILRPIELPIGVVTSLIGAVLFVHILMKTRKSS